MKEASHRYNIPYSSVRDWCYGIWRSRKRGPLAVLNPEEKQLLVDYLLAMCDLGYGMTPTALRLMVCEITKDRWTPFRNGIPSKGWMKWWHQRHPELTTRVAQALDSARARGLTIENAGTFMIIWRFYVVGIRTLQIESGTAMRRGCKPGGMAEYM